MFHVVFGLLKKVLLNKYMHLIKHISDISYIESGDDTIRKSW